MYLLFTLQLRLFASLILRSRLISVLHMDTVDSLQSADSLRLKMFTLKDVARSEFLYTAKMTLM